MLLCLYGYASSRSEWRAVFNVLSYFQQRMFAVSKLLDKLRPALAPAGSAWLRGGRAGPHGDLTTGRGVGSEFRAPVDRYPPLRPPCRDTTRWRTRTRPHKPQRCPSLACRSARLSPAAAVPHVKHTSSLPDCGATSVRSVAKDDPFEKLAKTSRESVSQRFLGLITGDSQDRARMNIAWLVAGAASFKPFEHFSMLMLQGSAS